MLSSRACWSASKPSQSSARYRRQVFAATFAARTAPHATWSALRSKRERAAMNDDARSRARALLGQESLMGVGWLGSETGPPNNHRKSGTARFHPQRDERNSRSTTWRHKVAHAALMARSKTDEQKDPRGGEKIWQGEHWLKRRRERNNVWGGCKVVVCLTHKFFLFVFRQCYGEKAHVRWELYKSSVFASKS